MGGIGFAMTFHIVGRTVVHPAATFDATSSLEAIKLERVTDMPAVPALVYAVLGNPLSKQVDTGCLKWVVMGATTILREVVKHGDGEAGCGSSK